MKREEITSIVYVNGTNKPKAIKFQDWVIEVDHHSQLNGRLNEVRDIAKHILSALNKSEVEIHLNTKTL